MIKGMLIFFGLFFGLVGLLFWVKMAPAQADAVDAQTGTAVASFLSTSP